MKWLIILGLFIVMIVLSLIFPMLTFIALAAVTSFWLYGKVSGKLGMNGTANGSGRMRLGQGMYQKQIS